MLVAASAAQVSIYHGNFAWRVATGCTMILTAVGLLGLYLRLPRSRFRSYIPPSLVFLTLFAGMPLGAALPHVLGIAHVDGNGFMAFVVGGCGAGGLIGVEVLFRIAMRHDLRLARAHVPTRLLRIYLAQQNLRLSDEGLIGHLAPSGEDDVPRLYAVRDRAETKRCVTNDPDLPATVRAQLQALSPTAAFDDPEAVATILGEDGPSEDVWRAHVYTFPELIGPHGFPDARPVTANDKYLWMQLNPADDDYHQPIFAVVVGGQVASLCRSRFEGNGLGHEAYVFTRPEFRRRGYARQTCLAWAHRLRHDGIIPFFSHANGDEAAAALAHSLRLIPAFDEVAYY